jgi:hypothetical protein
MRSTWMINTQGTASADLCSRFAVTTAGSGPIDQLLNGFGFATASRDVHGGVDNPGPATQLRERDAPVLRQSAPVLSGS